MTWLITGGCGFAGSNLADTLMSRGEAVVIVDNLSRVGSDQNLRWLGARHGDDLRFIKEDVRSAEVISSIVKETKPAAIAHLAGQVAMTTSTESPRLDFEVNVLGTFNVLEAVRQGSPDSIVIYASSNKVYGSLSHLQYEETSTRYMTRDYPDGLSEELPIDGDSPYGCSKLAADQYVRDYYRVYGIPTVVFRLSSIYGGRQFATFDQGWIAWFCLKALEMADADAPPFTISGDGKQVRDILHADDLARACVKAVENIEATAGQIYNIGGGNPNSLSLLELFGELEALTGNKLRFKKLDWRYGDQRFFVTDHRKATQHMGWKPKVEKRDGLSLMLDWSRQVLGLIDEPTRSSRGGTKLGNGQ